ncbi:outer membrane beta-barrel protein [Limibaculum sp. FT325]|uniref:outer membrane beta-barrel protein n=1 Tax=Thermohalobaculum sediminis TaxID=2939436 RepID=UPI0020BE4EF7|nr:outer membrane beta-barrel protein [Limibaculum sediminis]MCL5776924.1 outer membrane beta-barrel protein [Limibaculum sediminis]
MSADFWRYGHIGLAVLLASVSAAALAQDASSTGGDWDLDARLKVGERYDDNIFSTENDKRGDFITVIEPEVTLEGGNETYRLGLTAAAEIGVHAREPGEDYEDFLLRGEGRVNLGAESFLFGGADYAWLHEERSSADDVDGTRPTKYTEASGFVGASHDFGDVGLRVGANLRRFDFGNVAAAGGGVIDNNDRDRLMGVLGGAFLGYRADIGSILLGVELEGDMGAADWHHASNRNFGVERKDSIGGSAILGFRTRNDVLLYARAGAVGTSFETTYATGGAAASDTERRLGLRGGAGAEFPIGNGFSGRMEYVLTSYGDYDFGVSAPGDNFANMESVARIGLVYSLGEREARAPQPADTDTAGERWRRHHSAVRPHSAPGWRPPAHEARIPVDQTPVRHQSSNRTTR